MPASTLTITPLDPVGAEVHGLGGAPFDAETIAALNQAWLDHGILLFRDVHSVELHLALSRCFGELEVHPLPELRAKEDPHFFPLGGPLMLASVYDEREIRVNRIPWHRDTAFRPEICKGAMLRMLEVPPEEGETLLADTALAYDALPEDMKARIENLEYKAIISNGVHDRPAFGNWWKEARMARADEYPPGIEPMLDVKWPSKSGFPPVIYPVVLTHPESQRKCLFLSPMNIEGFLGMEPGESRELAQALVDHMTSHRFVYRHSWSVNDAILWDNRRFLHAAYGNKPEHKRRSLRTTLADKLHAGRYVDDMAATMDAGAAAAM